MAVRGERATKTIERTTLMREGGDALDIEDVAALAERPRTWGECRERTGPCPWVSCRAHRYLDVTPSGGLKLNFPELNDPMELNDPCVLRIAERGEMLLDDVGLMLNVTKEAARMVERSALFTLRRAVKRIR